MGVLNITPDSFSDGGKFLSPENALAQAERMIAEGADIIDVGGESSRPGAAPVTQEEELKRIVPIIDALRKNSSLIISVDTQKSEVAEECLRHGVNMINDITGLRDPALRNVVAKYKVPVVIMHMQGDPQTMQNHPTYHNVIEEIKSFFQEQIEKAETAGIERKNIILDPGIGFGKTTEHNLLILKHLDEFTKLNFPILVGTSRKGFIGAITGLPVDQRLEGTLASIAIAVFNGASIVRVHDVKEAKRTVQIAEVIKTAGENSISPA